MAANDTELYRLVADILGLSRIIAPGIIGRALRSQGATIETAMAADYMAVLPELERRTAIFVSAEEARARARDLRSALELRAAVES